MFSIVTMQESLLDQYSVEFSLASHNFPRRREYRKQNNNIFLHIIRIKIEDRHEIILISA